MTTTATPPPRSSRYTTGAIILHWTIALLIIAQIAGGIAMVDFMPNGSALQFDAYQLHKSFGITILILTMARICWRVFNPPPPEPTSLRWYERWLSSLVHGLFYAMMLAIPLSGWLMITVSPTKIDTVLYFSPYLPWPHLPGFGSLSHAAREAWEGTVIEVHEILAFATLGLLALHVAGALKHQLSDGRFIARMWPFGGVARKAYGRATTLAVTAAFAGAVIGGATLMRQEDATAIATTGATDGAAIDARATDNAASSATTANAAVPHTPAPAAAADTTADAPIVPTWAVRTDESTLTFSAKAMGKDAPGIFARWSADIRFDENALAASSIDVSIDLASATIDSGDITNAQLTGVDGLDAASEGIARFFANDVRKDESGNGFIAVGNLTLRGVTRPVELPFTLAVENGVGRASGSVVIDRTAFNVGTDADPQAGFVDRDVTVALDIVADRQGDPSPPPPAPAWTLVPAESALQFAFGFQGRTVEGTIGSFDADIRFDPYNLAGSSVAVTMDLGSASVSGTAVSDAQLKGADGFDTAAAANAHFQADTITAAGDGYAANGTLTVRGTSVPTVLAFTVEIDGDTAHAGGEATLRRLDFGIGAQNDASGEWLSKDVGVTMNVVARREGGESLAQQ